MPGRTAVFRPMVRIAPPGPLSLVLCHRRQIEIAWGSLEPGKLADLAVLTGDPLTLDTQSIKDISANVTMVGGNVVHESKDWQN